MWYFIGLAMVGVAMFFLGRDWGKYDDILDGWEKGYKQGREDQCKQVMVLLDKMKDGDNKGEVKEVKTGIVKQKIRKN